jgi:hypothetical protein
MPGLCGITFGPGDISAERGCKSMEVIPAVHSFQDRHRPFRQPEAVYAAGHGKAPVSR